MAKEIKLTAMPTPNPNTIKFLIDITFFERGSIDFNSKEKAIGSVLPEALFGVEGITGVMIGTNFVSITKKENTGWESVLEPTSEIIKELCAQDIEFFEKSHLEKLANNTQENSEVINKINEILDNEIRPAIAMDGGDCELVGFEDGILTLKMQGACSNCPSSVMTLKMGIENRLREDIPELKEVVQV
jgi:Fe-S cluster biogenesis protein NfuA